MRTATRRTARAMAAAAGAPANADGAPDRRDAAWLSTALATAKRDAAMLRGAGAMATRAIATIVAGDATAAADGDAASRIVAVVDVRRPMADAATARIERGMPLDSLFPRHDFVIETSWPPAVAAIEIRKRIAAPHAASQGDEPFLGRSIGETEFRFSRASQKSNLLPAIYVAVVPSHHEGARVQVLVRPNDVWLGLMAMCIFVATITIGGLMHGAPGALESAAVLPLLVLAGALARPAFQREARRTEAILRSIFAAAPGLPPPHDSGKPYR